MLYRIINVSVHTPLVAVWVTSFRNDERESGDVTQCGLGTTLSILLSNFCEGWIVNQFPNILALVINLIRIAETAS